MCEHKEWIHQSVLAQLTPSGDIWLDIHGYRHETAMQLIEDVMRVAHTRGELALVIKHGAAEIATRADQDASWDARGSVKLEIRERLDSGAFSRWASEGTTLDSHSGQSRIVLKPNDSPEEVAWPDCPERDYL